MKRRFFLFFAAAATLFVVSCKDTKLDTSYSFYVERKGVRFDNPTEVSVNEKITFVATGDGKVYSFWPGDSLHNYSRRNDVDPKDTLQVYRNVGLAMNKIKAGYGAEYSYSKRGQYNLTLVARNVDNFGADISEKIDDGKTIKVIDTAATIVSAKVNKWYWTKDSVNKRRKEIELNYSCKISGDSVIAFLDDFFFTNTPPRTFVCSFDFAPATAKAGGKSLSPSGNVIPFVNFPLEIILTSQEGTTRRYTMYLKEAAK